MSDLQLHRFSPFEIEYQPERLSALRSPEVVKYEVRRDLIALGIPIATAQLDITRDENTVTIIGLIATEAVRQLITDLANCNSVISRENLEKHKIIRINLMVNGTNLPNPKYPFTPRQSDGGKAKLFEPNKKVTSFTAYRLNKKGKSKVSSSTHVANESPEEDNTEPEIHMTTWKPSENAEAKIIRLEMELQDEKNAKQNLEWKSQDDQIIIDGLNTRILKLEERLESMERDRERLKAYVGNMAGILGK